MAGRVAALHPGHHLAMSVPTTYHPARDAGRVRKLWRLKIGLGLGWIVVGVAYLLLNGRPWLGVVFLTLGVAQLLVGVLAGRSFVEVDGDGVQWQGPLRSRAISWGSVDRVVIDDRGTNFGDVGITLHEKDGTYSRVPADALAGLEHPTNAQLRERLLKAVTAFADEAGITVRNPEPGDPLVM